MWMHLILRAVNRGIWIDRMWIHAAHRGYLSASDRR